MNAFFDSIAHAFEAMHVHPVLGAFIAGAVIVFVFMRASSRDPADPGVHAPASVAPPASVAIKSNIYQTENIPVMVNGRKVEFPPEVMTLIRAGNKIDAIKAVRTATGLDLKEAKEIVDKLAASPPGH